MNDYEAAERIKGIADISHIPVMAATSFAMAGDREEAAAIRCMGYIENPSIRRVSSLRLRSIFDE